MDRRLPSLSLSVLLLGACGSSATPADGAADSSDSGATQDAPPDAYWDGALPPNSVTGSIGGVAVAAASAIDTGVWDSDPDSTGVGALISSGSNLCNEESPVAGETWLQVSAIALDPQYQSWPSPLPAVVTVMTLAAARTSSDGFYGSASFTQGNGNCDVPAGEAATGGTITLYEITNSIVAGAFDLDFPDGHVAGTFTAPKCGEIVSNCP